MTVTQTPSIWTINLFNNGMAGDARKVSIDIQPWEYLPSAPYDRAKLMVKHQGHVYLAKDLLTELKLYPDYEQAIVLTGTGRRLLRVTRDMLDRSLESAARETRSTVEQAVSDRNFEALAFIESLMH